MAKATAYEAMLRHEAYIARTVGSVHGVLTAQDIEKRDLLRHRAGVPEDREFSYFEMAPSRWTR